MKISGYLTCFLNHCNYTIPNFMVHLKRGSYLARGDKHKPGSGKLEGESKDPPRWCLEKEPSRT